MLFIHLFEYVVKKIQTVEMSVEKVKFTSYTCSCNGSLPRETIATGWSYPTWNILCIYNRVCLHINLIIYIIMGILYVLFPYMNFLFFFFFFMNLLIFNRIYVVQKVWGHERWYMPQFSCQWYLFCSPVLIWQSFPWCFKICKLFKISCFKLQYNLLTQFLCVCVFYIHISLCTCYSQPMTY